MSFNDFLDPKTDVGKKYGALVLCIPIVIIGSCMKCVCPHTVEKINSTVNNRPGYYVPADPADEQDFVLLSERG